MKFLSKRMRITPEELHGERFFVRQPDPATGKIVRFATPLFLALVMINIADLVFAVDSVPAIFAITTDTYIVYTANIMAILGLRALYFALAALVHRFEYLKYALAIVLVFIGAKIFWNQIVGKVDPAISLGVTLSIIAAGIILLAVEDPWGAARRRTPDQGGAGFKSGVSSVEDLFDTSGRTGGRSGKASGRLGSYLPVSMALTLWRDTSRRWARSA